MCVQCIQTKHTKVRIAVKMPLLLSCWLVMC